MSSSIALGGSALSFNLSISRGVRNLIDFAHWHACANASKVKLIFTSSASSASSWTSSQGPYPDEVFTDARFAVGMGYGESKHVSEWVFITFLLPLSTGGNYCSFCF